ncbi:hypothetical protein TeGR_g11318 [Tetraparma gracilis]|uniref:START domain-containing protein n=1 Tax=Tetraparma gracilis TaxID=2962635 RepID=A0ABQ6MT62_9STRA|nr:hypothetical protein TeGR_g11318 [Tetraparma gracilis]
MERSANCHVDALTLAWALVSDLPGCFAGRRPAIPDLASLTFPPPPGEATMQRSLRLNMQATKKQHPYHLVVSPLPPPTASSSTPSYSISFRPSSPASVAVSGAFLLAPSKHGTCTLTMTARISTGGGGTTDSTSTATTGVDSSTPMTRAESHYPDAEYKDKVDDAIADHKIASKAVKGSLRLVVDKGQALQSEAADVPWENIKSDFPLTKMWIKHAPAARGERSIAWGKAACTVDCSANTVLAWSMAYCSRDRMRISEEEGNPARLVIDRRNPHSDSVATIKKLGEISDNSFEKIESPDHIVEMGVFHAGGAHGIPRATTIIDEDICTYLSRIRKLFDKSPAIDAASNLRLVDAIENHDDSYSTQENDIIDRGLANFVMFENIKSADVALPSPATKAKLAFVEGDSLAWGWASSEVRAPPAAVLAFVWNTGSRSKRKPDDLEKSVDESPNGHSMLVYNVKKTPGVISNRDFLGRVLWRAEGSGFVLVADPQEESARRPLVKDVVRGKYYMAVKITRVDDTWTKLEYVVNPDSGGSIPRWFVKRWVSSQLTAVTLAQEHFLSLRSLGELDEEDGKAVGNVMLSRTRAEKKLGKRETRVKARVRAAMEKQKGLKELAEKHEWIEVLLAKVVANKLRPAGDSKAKLCNMSVKEARVIGGALASCIAANLTAPAAVDEWILRFPAMGELDREYVWFRPMMDTIAQRLLESVGWGLKMRLYTGAGLSTLDLITDLYMIYTYATTGQQGTALSLAIMVGLCMAIQLFLTWVQAHKGPKLVMLKEMLIVLTALAPGIHAMRVANGVDKNEYDSMDADIVLTAFRCAEMCFESCPGSVLQTYAVFEVAKRGGGWSKQAIASIVVSALTTGFGAATISFDFDVSPQRRRDEPNFYGYIPDTASSRTLIFGCMIANGALLLLLRSVGTALLAMKGGSYVVYYFACDMCLYFMYKIARRDFWHWVPLDGAASVIESFVFRLMVKVLVDFTGVVQFRGAGEMGGCYFSFNMIMALAASLVSTHIYYASLEEGKEAVMEEADAWMMVGGLSGGLICFEAAFLLLMKPGFWGTFFSTQTGYQYVQSKFLREGDENKKAVFKYNKKQWKSIRDDVKAWTMENWERWEEEKPEWFNDAWKAGVDDDMIPPASLGALNGGGVERRRSSLGDVLGVSARVAPVAQ